MANLKSRKAVTLTEVIVSVVLLGMLMIVATTTEISVQNMNKMPRIENILRTKALSLLGHIKQDWQTKAIGTIYAPAFNETISGSEVSMKIRVDSDMNGFISSGDAWHEYKFGSAGAPSLTEYRVVFYPNASDASTYVVLAENVGVFTYYWHGNNSVDPHPEALSVGIELRKDPASPPNPLTNPAASLNETIYARQITTS